MKGNNRLVLAFVLILLLLATGCKREDKAVGLPPILPEGGTQLLFADCDPIHSINRTIGLQPTATLVGDSRYACNGIVSFATGDSAGWRSSEFHIPAGSYREGFHLAFERSVNDAGQGPAIMLVIFQGIATQFEVIDTIPQGTSGDALRHVLEVGQTGTAGASDSLRRVTIIVADLSSGSGLVNLNLDMNANGSYVKIGADPSHLCEFTILDAAHGFSHVTHVVSQAFDIHYDHASGDPADSIFLDFTHGAQVNSGHRLLMGDQFGVAYVSSQLNGCRDTTSYWALPPTQPFRQDTIPGNFLVGNIISDGQSVWAWDVFQSADSIPCGYVRVNVDSTHGTPIINQPIYQCPLTGTYTVYYDALARLIWVVSRATPTPDTTAWGYSTDGALDTVILHTDIPTGNLYRGKWVAETGYTLLKRTVVQQPFAGGAVISTHDFPTELTEDFTGGAGVGYPGAGQMDSSWSVNAFDVNGNWIAQYPVLMSNPQFQYINSVGILSADSVIVFAVIWNDINEQVRVLRPH